MLACIRYYSPTELVATKPIRLAKLLFIYIVLAQPKGAGYLYLLLLQLRVNHVVIFQACVPGTLEKNT